MLIKSIEVTNFRIFAGTQKVEFSVDPDKNVTVIMGDNGSGKTTFAQAFSWCLYETTTFKRANDLLSFTVRDELLVGQSATVKVTLTLIHNGTEYKITRAQEYRKDSETRMRPGETVLSVFYKADDGQSEPIEDESEKRDIINEIIPKSISSYFFFDGERVEKMGNEIQDGRSPEFKEAVGNLLGLSAISEAIKHLKGGPSMVIGSYLKEYNGDSDAEYQKAEKEIQGAEARISKLKQELADLEDKKNSTAELRDKYKFELEKSKESKEWAEQRSTLERSVKKASEDRTREIEALCNRFGKNAWSFFAAPLLDSSIHALDSSKVEIKQAPTGVNRDTIEDIVERKECLCGRPVVFGDEAYKALMAWIDIVPPQHMGAAVKNYRDSIDMVLDQQPLTLLDDVELHTANARRLDAEIAQNELRIEKLSKQLEGAKDMSDTERKYQTACRHIREQESEISEKTLALGMAEGSLRDAQVKRNSLTTNDETNKRVRRDKEYAEWIFNELNAEHSRKEAETRKDLESEINDIFREFFSGTLRLELDDRYNVTVLNIDPDSQGYDVETSEGQTVAVIFAFIAGVIRLATDEKRKGDEMLLTESYPLVMDAPMSKLDKKRIAAICEVVPRIAEQTIIMIKDTDGELAKEHLKGKVGVEYAVISIEPERLSEIERVDD